MEHAKQIFSELEAQVRAVYTESSDAPSPALEKLIRTTDKMKLLLDGDYEGLWTMEREDRQRVESVLLRTREKAAAARRETLFWRPAPTEERPNPEDYMAKAGGGVPEPDKSVAWALLKALAASGRLTHLEAKPWVPPEGGGEGGDKESNDGGEDGDKESNDGGEETPAEAAEAAEAAEVVQNAMDEEDLYD